LQVKAAMAEFQSILGIILIVSAIVIIALTIYNLIVLSKATISANDVNATLTDAEKKGAQGTNIIVIIISLVIGIYGVVLLLPEDRATRGVPALRGQRSLSGSVLAPTGEYM